MKTELTAQETAMIDVIRDKWINLAYDECGKGIDKEKFEKGINWLYNDFLKLPNPTIIYCDSLIEAAIKITMIDGFDMELSEYPSMLEKYRANALSLSFLEKFKENLKLRYSYIGWNNFGWVSFYDYFSQIGVVNHEIFNKYRELNESNVFETIEFEHVVFAIQPPKYIKRLNNLPHCVDGPSIEFYDETKYYSINGFHISEELLNGLNDNTYTFNEFATEKNEEIKSAVLQYHELVNGSEGVFNFVRNELNEIDTYVNDTTDEALVGTTNSANIGVYTLFKGNVNDENIAYVRCYCPSTDRMFFLGVEYSNDNAKDAIASLYRVPLQLKDNIVSISRQGEKFSTIFDDITTAKIQANEFQEFNEYVSITGDEYFKLMKYEY
jgi:hypothetical protein